MRNEYNRTLSALNYLDSECPRKQWFRIGAAAKAADLSFDDFHKWSKHAKNYKGEVDCRSMWNSIKPKRGINAGTLLWLAKQAGWKDDNSRVSQKTVNNFSCGKSLPISGESYDDIELPKPSSFSIENKHERKTLISADELWSRCIPASADHPYIARKGGTPDGLRVYPASAPLYKISGDNIAGYLAVPCYEDGKLQTIQFIPPHEGKKLNAPGCHYNNGYFLVGEETSAKHIVEGIGQAWAAAATGKCAVVCFGAGRMMTVATKIRNQNPDAQLIVIPDRGKETEASKISSAINAEIIELPQEKPSNYDVNDYTQEYGYEALVALLASTKAPEMRYKTLSAADLLSAPPMRWLIKGVLPASGLAALYGASGCGKSFLVLDMAFAIAGGDEFWFKKRVVNVPVTYVCLEGEDGMSKRIKAWSKRFDKYAPKKLRFITQSFNLLSKDDIPQLANAILASGGANGLVIIDTLNRAAPGADENSPKDMGNIIAATKTLQSLTGGILLLVHHIGKDATKGLRGHSSLYAALDAAIEVSETGQRNQWRVTKSKDEITGNSYAFERAVIPLGILDDDGDEVTSCVVLFDASVQDIKRKIPGGVNQKIALEEIKKHVIYSGDISKEGVPSKSPCIKYDEALLLVAARMANDKKHKKSTAKTAIGGLVANGFLGLFGDWLWVV